MKNSIAPGKPMDVASGVTISNCYRRQRHQEFLRFLNDVEGSLPPGLEVHLVMDNYGTHKVAKVKTWLARPLFPVPLSREVKTPSGITNLMFPVEVDP